MKSYTQQKHNLQAEANICRWCELQGINFQNIQTIHKAQLKKTIKKIGRLSKETFLQIWHIDGQEAHEKMFNITIIGEMQIKTIMKYHLILVRMDISKNSKTINARDGVEKREPSYTVGGNENWYSHYGKQYAGSLKN